MRECRKYWLIAVSSLVSWVLRNSMTFWSPCMAVSRCGCVGHDYSALQESMTKRKWGWFADALAMPRNSASGGDRDRQCQADVAHGLIENAPGFGLAAAAAGRTTGAGLQIGKGAHAVLRR